MAVINTTQLDLFGDGKSYMEIQIDGAIKLLQSSGYHVVKTNEQIKNLAVKCGYKVLDAIVVNSNITTLKELRDHFYTVLYSNNPSSQLYSAGSNWKQDYRLMKLFVEAREATGLNRFNAVQECVAIIDIIFKYKEQFNFKTPIDIRVLGQDKAGWITQKAVSILNNSMVKMNEQIVDAIISKKDEEQVVDLEQQSLELKKILDSMG